MRANIPFLAALSLGLASPVAVMAPAPMAFAQAQDAEAPIKQIALSQKQIDSYLAAKKDIDAILEKMPESAQGQAPDPKVTAQLDGVAKKGGFANYDEYLSVEDNIGLVMQGIDPRTKKYVGAETVIKQEIASVKADKSMPPKDKKEALDQLNAALKSAAPVQNQANIDLVTKNFDKISAAMPQEQEEEQPKKM
jgi:hypothetical protein